MLIHLQRLLLQEYRRGGSSQHANGVGPTIGLLDRFGPLTPTQIARLTGLPKPSVARLLRNMHDDRFIHFIEDHADARSKHVVISNKGHELILERRQCSYAIFSGEMSRLSSLDKRTMQLGAHTLTRLLAKENPGWHDVHSTSEEEPVHEVSASAGFLRLMAMLSSRFIGLAGTCDLSQAQLSLLIQLGDGCARNPSQIAETEYLSRSAVTALLDGLGRHDLIEYDPRSLDARYHYHRISDKGRAYLQQWLEHSQQRLATLMQTLQPLELYSLEQCAHLVEQRLQDRR